MRAATTAERHNRKLGPLRKVEVPSACLDHQLRALNVTFGRPPRTTEGERRLPGGGQIPFCAYNTVGYREQARVQLDAMEQARKQARRQGRPYAPQPVTFDPAAFVRPTRRRHD